MAIKKTITNTRYTRVTIPLTDKLDSAEGCELKVVGGEYVVRQTKVTDTPVKQFFKAPKGADLNDVSIDDGCLYLDYCEEV